MKVLYAVPKRTGVIRLNTCDGHGSILASFRRGLCVKVVRSAPPNHPVVPHRLFRRTGIVEVIDTLFQVVPIEHLRDGGTAAIPLENLVHREPSLNIFLRLVVEDVFASIRARVKLVTCVLRYPKADSRWIARLGEGHGNLADLA